MDGALDSYEMYRLAERERVNLITPPKKGSKYKIGIDRSKRDETLQMIYKMGNNEELLKKWKTKGIPKEIAGRNSNLKNQRNSRKYP